MPPVPSLTPSINADDRGGDGSGGVKRCRRRRAIRVVLALYWLVLITATHWPGLTKEDVPDLGWLPFDKVMHVLTFAGLAALLTWSRWFPRHGGGFNAVAAVAIGLVYGGLEEITQPYFGRTAALDDLLADLIGLVIGAGCAAAFAHRLKLASPHAEGSSACPITDRAKPSGEGSDFVGDSGDGPGGGGGGGGGDENRFVGHAALVGALTLVSRVTGLVRDAVLAAVFGASLYLDAFLIGFIVPNLFRRLFGEGALTAAFIPRYTKLLKEDPALARRFASLCVVVIAMLLAGITLVGELVLWIALARGVDEKAGLALRLTMMMLPYMPMVCGVAFLGAILQVHRKFGPAAAAPVLLNLIMIAAAAIAGWQTLGEWSSISVIALSVLLAGLIQLTWMGVAVFRTAPLTSAFAGTRDHFHAMLRTMLPMVIGLGVFQINTLLDGLIAFTFAHPPPPEFGPAASETFMLLGRTFRYPIEPGAVTTLTLAQRLYQFPLGVFGIAIATAIFPALARAAAERSAKPQAAGHTADDFADVFRRGLRLTLFIGVPASVGLILVRVPLTRVFFEWNAFTADDALRCAAVLTGYASAVWAYSVTHVVTKAYYAVDDATTPLKVSVAMVFFNLALNLTLIWPLGVAGLAWSTAISAALQTLIMLALLRKHIAQPITGAVFAAALRVVGLTVLMGAAVAAVVWSFDVATLTKAGCLGVLGAGVGAGAIVYLGGAWLAGMPEVRELRR